MEFTKIIKTKDNYFQNETSSNAPMCFLSRFLTDDVTGKPHWFIEWLYDDTQQATEGNITTLEKNGEIILIGDLYSEQPDGGPWLKITKDQFIEILTQWQKFWNDRPQEITITQDENGVITIDAIYDKP